jgi:hypothetical protein
MFTKNEERFLEALGNLQRALNARKTTVGIKVRNPLFKNNKKTGRSPNRNRTPKRTN